MPRLLDAGLREKARLMPLSLSLTQTLNAPASARMTLPPASPVVAPRDLVEVYDQHGSAGIFRVTKAEEDLHRSRTLTLTHAICTLSDGMTTGNAFSGTVRAALEVLLACQPDPLWQLGTVDLPEDMTVLLEGKRTDLYTALEELLALLPDGYSPDYDQTGFPWLLHLRALPDAISCEGRLNRNIEGLCISTDEAGLCTRVYPYGAEQNGIRLSLAGMTGSEFLQAPDTENRGVVCASFHSDLIFDAPTLQQVAQLYLDRHSQPDLTLTVDALDVSQATGLPLDAFPVGALCRISLPDRQQVYTLRICARETPDVYSAPEHVRLTLRSHARQYSPQAEITALIRQVTASRLLGGTVVREQDENRADGTAFSPIVHFFELPENAHILDVHAVFTPDSGVRMTDVRVDDVYLPAEAWRSGELSCTAALKRDDLGCILPGEHRLILYPSTGVYNELAGVHSVITMTYIQPR